MTSTTFDDSGAQEIVELQSRCVSRSRCNAFVMFLELAELDSPTGHQCTNPGPGMGNVALLIEYVWLGA